MTDIISVFSVMLYLSEVCSVLYSSVHQYSVMCIVLFKSIKLLMLLWYFTKLHIENLTVILSYTNDTVMQIKVLWYQNSYSINCIPPLFSPFFQNCCMLPPSSLSSKIIDRSWCSRCLNNWLKVSGIIRFLILP